MSRPAAPLRSLLAGPIGAFLQYKTALGCKYKTEAAALHQLDAYLAEQRVVVLDQLDSRLIEAFLVSRPRERPRSYNHLVGAIRRFFDWAVLQEVVECNPVKARPRRETAQRISYLFSLTDAQRLLKAAHSMRTRPKAPHRALVYETVFALLYGLGLRVGEVTRLLVGDVDFERATLSVRDTKFYKSRLVPFGQCMGERLAHYLDRRFGQHADPDAPLFSFTRRGAVHEGTISQTFHLLLPQLELDVPAGVRAPRLHDLRHAFAVGTLLRWYRSGVDPNTRLIHLSTLLGHADPASTAVYLTITEELLREADRRFRVFAPGGGRS
ncbi:integrase [Verminephrobacter eiseniae]|uniref:tyrosine-type recombinase/integrase n=1 Tax=Verminephrobacter eiseniae TaxID=364317 RepID=UPI0022376E9F|nr:tyrosine-type recombinase/integrase [Verminephrobacter eiseniae]MCW5260038.1 integrase [Verminephrobacter eiseniae]